VPTWRQSVLRQERKDCWLWPGAGELNYGRIAKSKNSLPIGSLNAIKRIPLLERRGILMQPELEKNEVLEGATLKQWRRPVLRKLAISATEQNKTAGNEGGGVGKGDAGPPATS
jgi:hypothetical protein